MNPEFRRNLWLEVSPLRLAAAPPIVFLLFWTVNALWAGRYLANTAYLGLAFVLVVWGARLAADTLVSEIVGHTWEGQRMSALSPWQMTWGKLFGATVYAWYIALWLALVALFWAGADSLRVAGIVMTGLFVQATTMLVALLIHRMRLPGQQFHLQIAHSLGMLSGLPFLMVLSSAGWAISVVFGGQEFMWFGLSFAVKDFVLLSEAALTVWVVIGVFRLMRGELQYHPRPAVWALFLVFAAIYTAGLDLHMVGGLRAIAGILNPLARIYGAFLILIGLTYASAFFDPKSLILLRQMRLRAKARRWGDALAIVPLWMVSLLFAGIFGLAVIALYVWGYGHTLKVLRDAGLDNGSAISPVIVISMLAFAARDIGMFHVFTLNPAWKRGHLAAVVYLAGVLAVIPAALNASGADALVPLLIPSPVEATWLTAGLALMEAGLVFGVLALLVRRWGKQT